MVLPLFYRCLIISIHALREESDFSLYSTIGNIPRISIHALREESDTALWTRMLLTKYFNPRPPRGERPRRYLRSAKALSISIHALREEGDARSG